MIPGDEFDRSLQAFGMDVEERWQSLYPHPPSTVYHYTNSCGFTGIVQSRRLWATVSSELNDIRELLHASEGLRAVLSKHSREAALPEYQVLYPPQVLEMDYARSDLATIFVASLSGSEDDLPQWCMYADHFYGLALGFDSRAFVDLDEATQLDQGIGFFGVSYSAEEQDEYLEWLVTRWERDASSGTAQGLHRARDPLMFMASWFGNLGTAAISVLPRMKSRHFRSENEWRLVHMHVPNVTCCAVLDTPGKPHVALDIAQRREFPLISVWLGPGVANDQSKRVVRHFLDTHGFEHVPIKLSEIPLRGSERVLSLAGHPNSL